MLLEEGVPFVTISGLHLVISIQALQRRSGDVNLSVGRKGGERGDENKLLLKRILDCGQP